MSKLDKEIFRKLDKIRRDCPDADKLREIYYKAHAHYVEAVITGDGSAGSGSIITEFIAIRDACAIYAKENNIDLEEDNVS